jgi:hypothetical protein
LLPGDDILFSTLSMNTKQAKAEPLHEFLGRLGFEPARIRGDDLWYRSPFRPNERTPSFKIDRVKNVWYDHAMGQGGTIIDFVAHLNGTQEISRVLSTIEGILGQSPAPRIVIPRTEEAPRTPPVIESVREIQDKTLETYLGMRGIAVDLARMYLKEIAYRAGEKSHRALALANDAGGYEIRNPAFKGTIGKKDTTFIPGTNLTQSAVFEGVFDFLSVLTHYQRDHSAANVLILNSLSLLERGGNRLRETNTERLYTYLDHDDAGRAGMIRLSELGEWEVLDGASFYQGYKDANEFLVGRRQVQDRDDDRTR